MLVALALAGGAVWAGTSLLGAGTRGVAVSTGAAACSDSTITAATGAGIRATTLLPGMQPMPGGTERMVEYGTPGDPSGPRVQVTLGPPGPLLPPALPPSFPTHPVRVAGQAAVAAEPIGAGSVNVYWRLGSAHDAALTAWNMTEAQAISIAAGVVYDPGAIHTLPPGPGATISHDHALAAAAEPNSASAKLTAWSEWAALGQPSGATPAAPPAGLDQWSPVWVVSGGTAGQTTVTIVNAKSGTVLGREAGNPAPRYLTALTDRSTASCPGTPLGALTRPEVTYLVRSTDAGAIITAKLVSTQSLERAAGGELTQCQFRPCSTSAVWLILAHGGVSAFSSSPGGTSAGPGSAPTTTTASLPPSAHWSIYPVEPLSGRGLGDSGTGQGPDPSYFAQLTDLDPAPLPAATSSAAGCQPVPLTSVSTDSAGARFYAYPGGMTQVIPPPGFNPADATDDQLRRYGLPPRSPQGTRARQIWDTNVGHATHPAPPGISTCPRSSG